MRKLKKNRFLLLVLCMCLVLSNVVPVQAASKYSKYKGTWEWSGDPTLYMKIYSISASKIKFKLSVSGSKYVMKNGISYNVGNFRDSTKTITKKLKSGRGSFTIKSKKGYKLKMKFKTGKYYHVSGVTVGAYIQIKSSNKVWNTGSGWYGGFKV